MSTERRPLPELDGSYFEQFLPGGKHAGLWFFDEDWFRYWADGTFEVHELCLGCEPDGACPFHPVGCECSNGECQYAHCEGCDNPDGAIATYRVTHHDGSVDEKVRYCSACADLAKIDWNGETAAIERA